MLSNQQQYVYKVGIVILNYKNAECCLNCVDSILKNESYPDLEIVVVDNATPDLTTRAELKNGLPKQVHFIQSEKNDGFAAGNNIGARFLVFVRNVDLVLFLNSDTLIEMPVVHELCAVASVSEIGAVSPIIFHDRNPEQWRNEIQVRRLPSLVKLMVVNSTFLSRLPIAGKWKREYLYKECMPWQDRVYSCESINGACFMMRSETLRKIGFLDERTFLYYEELLIGYKLREIGLTCALNAVVRVFHIQGQSTGAGNKSFPLRMFRHQLRSFEVLVSKYLGFPVWLAKIFSAMRLVEYHLKRLLLWIVGK